MWIFSPGQKSLSFSASSSEGSSVSAAAIRMETAMAIAVPTPLKSGTFARAMTMYATTTVTPAVRTAWPAQRIDIATLSSVEAPFDLSSLVLRSWRTE